MRFIAPKVLNLRTELQIDEEILGGAIEYLECNRLLILEEKYPLSVLVLRL